MRKPEAMVASVRVMPKIIVHNAGEEALASKKIVSEKKITALTPENCWKTLNKIIINYEAVSKIILNPQQLQNKC